MDDDALVRWFVCYATVVSIMLGYLIIIQLLVARVPFIMLPIFMLVSLKAQANERPWNPLRRQPELLPN
jgi:hypothetical protein